MLRLLHEIVTLDKPVQAGIGEPDLFSDHGFDFAAQSVDVLRTRAKMTEKMRTKSRTGPHDCKDYSQGSAYEELGCLMRVVSTI